VNLLAEEGKLVTFGIGPTGYVDIKSGAKLSEGYKVEKFVEKPGLETAQGYIGIGKHLWNSGMFMFKASR
jgi:mannose-1-phosphate guanylyltransferase